MKDAVLLTVGVLSLLACGLALVLLWEEHRKVNALSRQLEHSRNSLAQLMQMTTRENTEVMSRTWQQLGSMQNRQMETMGMATAQRLEQMENLLRHSLAANEQRLEMMRQSNERSLNAIREENRSQIAEMRAMTEEKLEKTLETRIGESFRTVSERLEQVYKGLGEMQNLASGVGDLKKVLSGVKTRGILGEVQLGAILEEILSPEQYECNVETRRRSGRRVEYAVRLPGADGGTVYLPVDAKFPAEPYMALEDAYEAGDTAGAEAAAAVLTAELRRFARDIRDKYVDPPATTEFAVLFLPFEGLYAEAVRRGMVEQLQREFRITIAGPTTMAALLNSLQMGFRTLAIQKRSAEVWQLLSAVRTEFDKFGEVLENTQKRLEQTGQELDRLVGVRTRMIRARLRDVTVLPDADAELLLDRQEENPQ